MADLHALDSFEKGALQVGCAEFALLVRDISACPVESFGMDSHKDLEMILFVTRDHILHEKLPPKIRNNMASMREIIKAHVVIVAKNDNFENDSIIRSLQGTSFPIRYF